MSRLIQTLHVYAGLQACVALLIFGVSGLVATFERRPGHEPALHHATVPFPLRPGESDAQLAQRVYEWVALPLSRPMPPGAVRRDPQGNLPLRFASPNGYVSATVLADRGVLRVTSHRNDLGTFLLRMHEETFSVGSGRARSLQLWSLYVELSIWSLVFLTVSGAYQWLATRPRHRLAQLSLGASCAGFALLWWLGA